MKKSIFSWATIGLLVACISLISCEKEEPIDNSDSRYISVYPGAINFGATESSDMFLIYSYNGATNYKLYIEGDGSWISFSEVEGTIPEYKEGNHDSTTNIYAYVDRSGLTPGNYSCIIIVRTDVGEKRITVSMTVPTNGSGTGGNGTGGGENPNPNPEPDYSEAEVSTELDYIDVNLISCIRKGNEVALTYTMTNTYESDMNISITNVNEFTQHTFISDNWGTQYPRKKVKISLAGKEYYYGYELVLGTLLPGIPTKCVITVKDVAEDATHMHYYIYTERSVIGTINRTKDIIFKNIKIH